MRRLGKLFQRSAFERRLFLRAVFLLWEARFLSSFLPIRSAGRALRDLRRRPSAAGPRADAGIVLPKALWALETAGRHAALSPSCLVKSLAFVALLEEEGLASDLRIGVSKEPGGRFEAHAWVEREGRVLLGAPEPGRFTPLPVLTGEGP